MTMCAGNSASSIYATKIIILYIGIGILGLSIAYVIFFVISLTKAVNDLWNFLSSLSLKNYSILKATYLNRLSMVNGIDENDLSDIIIKDKPELLSFKISFSQIWRYVWRLLIFAFLSILFYIIVVFIFCTDIENIIKYRPAMINMFTQTNNNLRLLTFYMVEVFAYNTFAGLNHYFPQIIIFESPYEKIDSLIEEFNLYKKEFTNPEYMQYIPADMHSLLFYEWYNISMPFSTLGVYPSMINAVNEIHYIAWTQNFIEYSTFVRLIPYIFDVLGNSSLTLNNQLKVRLNNTFDIIITATVLYSILSIFLYFFVYLPYLNNDIQHWKKIQSLTKLAKK